jgi:hypothetical protein
MKTEFNNKRLILQTIDNVQVRMIILKKATRYQNNIFRLINFLQ